MLRYWNVKHPSEGKVMGSGGNVGRALRAVVCAAVLSVSILSNAEAESGSSPILDGCSRVTADYDQVTGNDSKINTRLCWETREGKTDYTIYIDAFYKNPFWWSRDGRFGGPEGTATAKNGFCQIQAADGSELRLSGIYHGLWSLVDAKGEGATKAIHCGSSSALKSGNGGYKVRYSVRKFNGYWCRGSIPGVVASYECLENADDVLADHAFLVDQGVE